MNQVMWDDIYNIYTYNTQHAVLRLCMLGMLFIKLPKMLNTRSFVVLLLYIC